ncbi:hypothetical protein SAMN05444274_105322 [Mariniphaga anaerophila]|uniref:Uncharacterized protein n=1 Tax=Mariniphaga anaerophila TaxID=1484053 RepID=A0A1M5BV39_9BACT|nr:hypothetical protein [Mariniphaga anaerophila]SHF46424.1 hypothetical protein SAMN05444274_105322 [Mariniphaga anaerophila]
MNNKIKENKYSTPKLVASIEKEMKEKMSTKANYSVNTNVQNLMSQVIQQNGTIIRINDYLSIGTAGYQDSYFSVTLQGRTIQCSGIDIGNNNPSGEYELRMYSDVPTTSYDNWIGSTFVSRRYVYTIWGVNGVPRQDFWFIVLAESVSDFESVAY